MKREIRLLGKFVLTSLLIYLSGCQDPPIDKTIRYASGPAIIEAPAHAAYKKGFFKNTGLQVNLKILPDGKTALSKLLEDKYDLAAVIATPVVIQSFHRKDFSIIAVVEHPKFHHLLVNNYRINSLQDLKGKKIGVTPGTSGEYYMHSFLLANEIPEDKIEKTFYTFEQLERDIKTGGTGLDLPIYKKIIQAMNGRIYDPDHIRKNREKGRFEETT